MNKLQHLKLTKQYLRKVLNYRKQLNRINARRRMSGNMVKSMVFINYQIGEIDNFDRMIKWISQLNTQQNIIELIPKNKTIWRTELTHLITEGNILKGVTAKPKQYEFSFYK